MFSSTHMRCYFPFQNNLLDYSGHGAENTFAATYSYGAGHAGAAIRFNGSSSNRLEILGAGAGELLPASGAISVCSWVYKAAGDASKEYVVSTAGDTSQRGFRLYFTNDGRIRLIYVNGTTTVADVSTPVSSTAWLHIAFTWSGVNGGLLRLYLNGKEVDSASVSWTRDDEATWHIAHRRSYSEYGDIRLQHFCVYSAELPHNEIVRNYMNMHAVQH